MIQRKARATKPRPPLVGPALGAASSEHHLQQSAITPPVFDPTATLIRMPDLLAMTGLQRATVYKRLKDDPTFPRPVPLSSSTAQGAPVAFVLAEVQAWVRARIEARGAAA